MHIFTEYSTQSGCIIIFIKHMFVLNLIAMPQFSIYGSKWDCVVKVGFHVQIFFSFHKWIVRQRKFLLWNF